MNERPNGASAPLNVLLMCRDDSVRFELVALVVAIAGEVFDPHAETGLAAARLCAVAHPDVVVVDVVDAGGEFDVQGIACASPSTVVVVFTARSDRRTAARLLDAGASAVVSKSDSASLQGILSDLARAKAA